MSATQHETFSPQKITVLGGLLLIAILLGEVVFSPHRVAEVVDKKEDTLAEIALRIKPVVSLDEMKSHGSVAPGGADTANKTPDQLYQGACLACHTTGAAGAPKIGDAVAWNERKAKGIDELVATAINGIGAMPPRGGSQYNEEQIRAVIEYILSQSR